MSQSCSHSLDTSTAYIIERILFSQRPTGSLGVRTQSQWFRILRIELFHDLCPKHTSRTHLGNFHKVIGTDSPEERQTRSKSIDIYACGNTGTKVFKTVGQRISQLNVCRSSRFLHVVTGDRDRVELRHLLRSIFENIGYDLHGECRRINISITHHEFFQDVILDSTCHFFQFSTLFQTGIDIECQNWKNSTIHSHGHRHLVQRNTIEKNLHILQWADRYTGLAHITYHTFMVRVVAAMCSQVEGYRQTFLSGSQITTVECIWFFSCRESGILTDCPRA